MGGKGKGKKGGKQNKKTLATTGSSGSSSSQTSSSVALPTFNITADGEDGANRQTYTFTVEAHQAKHVTGWHHSGGKGTSFDNKLAYGQSTEFFQGVWSLILNDAELREAVDKGGQYPTDITVSFKDKNISSSSEKFDMVKIQWSINGTDVSFHMYPDGNETALLLHSGMKANDVKALAVPAASSSSSR